MTQTSALYRKRVRTNRMALMLSMMAMILGMSFLAWILVVLLYKGFGALSLSLFTQPTPAPGSDGGLFNAILGSVMMVGMSSSVATQIGILAGIYFAGVWAKGVARTDNTFYQRHSSIGTVDCCWYFIYGLCGAGSTFLGFGRIDGACADRNSCRCAYHRKHAESRSGKLA